MRRLTENTVDLGFKTAWRLATSPTMFWMGSTTEGITFLPSAEWITLGAPPSITAIHEFVVQRSIPMIFAIIFSFQFYIIFSFIGRILFPHFHLRYPNHFSMKRVPRKRFFYHNIIFSFYNFYTLHTLRIKQLSHNLKFRYSL